MGRVPGRPVADSVPRGWARPCHARSRVLQHRVLRVWVYDPVATRDAAHRLAHMLVP